MKPIEELIELTSNEIDSSILLKCSPEYIRSWRPKLINRKGKDIIEFGVEPSGGFIGCSLAILRNNR